MSAAAVSKAPRRKKAETAEVVFIAQDLEAEPAPPRVLPPLEVFNDLEQGSAAWLAARAGIPTASEFADIMTSGRGGAPSQTRVSYADRVAGELLGALPGEAFTSREMERGKEWEARIRTEYEFVHDVEVKEVGFMRRGRAGYSPDGLVGDDGLIEIKTHKPAILNPILRAGMLPKMHRDQVQGGLLISGRKWCDLICYWEGLPTFRLRVYRDEEYIEQLATAIDEFNALVDQFVAEIRAYGAGGLAIAAG